MELLKQSSQTQEMEKLVAQTEALSQSKNKEIDELKASLLSEREKTSELERKVHEQSEKILALEGQLQNSQTAEELRKFVESKVGNMEVETARTKA